MSEAGDYDPGPWMGYDFKSARKTYDTHVGRSYDDAVTSGKKPKDLVEKVLKTESEAPLVIVCDVTGSMGEWPATIFSKLPYLELEGKEYLGKTMEISFAAIGDANCDSYPLQVRPFDSGKNLEKRLKELIIEGGGGDQVTESYELAALYYARNTEMPNAIKPVIIFIGDEMPYDFISKDQAETWTYNKLQSKENTKQIFGELNKKYSVYLIRKPYEDTGTNSVSSVDKKIEREWETYVDADHIAILPEAGRVVDVIFGILAKETSRIDYFKKELTERQKPEQVDTVLKSLSTIHKLGPKKSAPKLTDGKSVTKRNIDGDKSKSLL